SSMADLGKTVGSVPTFQRHRAYRGFDIDGTRVDLRKRAVSVASVADFCIIVSASTSTSNRNIALPRQHIDVTVVIPVIPAAVADLGKGKKLYAPPLDVNVTLLHIDVDQAGRHPAAAVADMADGDIAVVPGTRIHSQATILH